ncbi:MAG: hypothetical protein K6F50_07900 [Kiritimatiellae bacterium]|nr:hypothetical protein [Kiritimatiellia bacterium]
MKKLICGLAIASAAACFAGEQNDLRVTFSTKGTDKYADGSTVRDGEFYALVWSPATFQGFKADGSTVSKDDEVIATVPFAKGGRLPLTLAEIDAAEASKYEEGAFSVVLLDTRNAAGEVEADAKAPSAVNGYETTATVSLEEAAASASLGVDSAVKVSVTSAVPADAPKPVITGVKKEGDFLILTVKGTAAYLRYNVAGGATPDAIGTAGTAEAPKDGAASAEDTIELKVPAEGSSGFYKVIRN